MTQDPNDNVYCNNTINQSQTIDVTETIVYIPVCFFGIILNAFAIWVFCCRMGKWTETRVYMTNLALSDFLFVCILPLKIIYRAQTVTIPCLIMECAYFINRYMSVFLITITALDRYIAITYPLRAKDIRSPLKSVVVCGVLWTLMISLLCIAKVMDDRTKGICFRKINKEPSPHLFASVIWGFLIPLTILSFCSIEVTRKLKKKKRTHPHEARLIQKAINIICANIIVFIICFLPLHVAILIQFIADSTDASCTKRAKISIFLDHAGILANTNCCLDAICYYFVNKEFQEVSLELTTKYQSPENEDSDAF
ncbi:G-protein coupled receptor 35 isoform X1 [Pogona vitticeps]